MVFGRRRSAKGADMAAVLVLFVIAGSRRRRGDLPKPCNDAFRRTKIVLFQKIILYLSNILTNTESVSLFPNRERRKFIAARNRQTSCRVVSVFCGYRRGSCRLFYLARYPTTYDSEMGFGTTLSFFIYAAGVRVAEKIFIKWMK